jgi:TolB-like protein/DNA-binding winged helix-turn-helix (wHTH) protein
MASPGREIYEFGAFRLDIAERRLSERGTPVTLPPKLFDTLALLVREGGRLVAKETFMQSIWPDTFVSDVTLAHNISALRRLLGHTDANPVIETVAKKGYRFAVPVAEAARHHPETPTDSPALAAVAARPRASWPAVAIGLMLVATLAGAYYFIARAGSATASEIQSVVVLPLENISGEASQNYLADGVTEALTIDLAKISALRVISRTTAVQYKGAQKPLDQIARELDVDAVVEGTLAREGDRLRVTAKLMRANPEKQLWAEIYERNIADFATLQSELTEAIALVIRAKLTETERAHLARRRSSQPSAYEAYLRARYFESGAAGPAAERAIENYQKAIAIDPRFVAAHAGLARAYIFGVRMPPKLALAAAQDASEKARAIDPDAPDALLASAITRLYYARDLAGADQEFRRAVDADPGNAETHFYHSQCLAAMGRFAEAIDAARRAQRLDPLSPLIGHYIGRIYYFSRDYDKAVTELRRALELNPNYAFTHMYFVTSYERVHDYDRALDHRQKYWALTGKKPEEVAELSDLARASGYPAALRRWAQEAADSVERRGYMTSTELTHVYAEIGDFDAALGWLERAFGDHVRDLIYVRVEPGFDPLRKDSRFARLLQQIYR